jgi:hypothetical protein
MQAKMDRNAEKKHKQQKEEERKVEAPETAYSSSS